MNHATGTDTASRPTSGEGGEVRSLRIAGPWLDGIPAFPWEQDVERLLAQCAGMETHPAATTASYLDIAEVIVDQALPWLDGDGLIHDPVEGPDQRWQGGVSSRFACPAAVLVCRRGRTDLIEPTARALTQVATGILQHAIDERDTPWLEKTFAYGVIDLMFKEFIVAAHLMRDAAPREWQEVWRPATTALPGPATYTATTRLAGGGSCHNYAASAATAEWLRLEHGLGGDREWLETKLACCLAWVTAGGLFRDPGDPMLYDLMVRQNFTELLAHGYDGQWQSRLETALERAGMLTLATLAPTGFAPPGGRSNLLLHNEAMLCAVCEFQARHWSRSGRTEVAAAFREAALRAVQAVLPFTREAPVRATKNWFPPHTRHGKDSGYGEYSNYLLLAASLFARNALLADDALPALTTPLAAHGAFLHLWPEFHRTFVTCGDTHAVVDIRAQAGYDATGIVRFVRAGAPPALALALGIPETPHHVLAQGEPGRAAAMGPCWQRTDGQWCSLASMGAEIEHVDCAGEAPAPGRILWRMTWHFRTAGDPGGGPVTEIEQCFALRPGELEITVRVTGVIAALGFEVPCLAFDGRDHAHVEAGEDGVQVCLGGWCFRVTVQGATTCELDPIERANRQGVYRIARFTVPGTRLTAHLALHPAAEA